MPVVAAQIRNGSVTINGIPYYPVWQHPDPYVSPRGNYFYRYFFLCNGVWKHEKFLLPADNGMHIDSKTPISVTEPHEFETHIVKYEVLYDIHLRENRFVVPKFPIDGCWTENMHSSFLTWIWMSKGFYYTRISLLI